jgi:hypothetical protein
MKDPVSIQTFDRLQASLFFPMAIPFVSVVPSLINIGLNLARTVHGVAMSLFHGIRELCGYRNKERYFDSAVIGAISFVFGIGNLATLGIPFFGYYIYTKCC